MLNHEGQDENGFLQVHDIYNLNLANTELVVLSACQTALGRDIRGEGLVGLTRGFMYAGSKSVVASLWKVDDRATAELMKHFYRGMFQERLTPAAALRQAKITTLNQQRWRAPFFWAAFTLQGEYRNEILVPPQTNSSLYRLIVALVGVMAVSLIVFLLYTHKVRSRPH
jgi:CHAT domain-containing protein